MVDADVKQDNFYWFRRIGTQCLTVDSGEVKTAPTECKEKCFQMSHLPIFTTVKHLNVDDSSKKEVR